MLGLDNTQLSDSVPNLVPLVIIVILTLLFVAYNPWGWAEWFLILEIFGLHLVPILTLAPITYLAVRFVTESGSNGDQSETADRIRSWFMLTPPDSTDEDEHESKQQSSQSR